MVRLFSIAPIVLAASAILSACTGTLETPGADQILAMPEDVQRQAHLTCQAEQGLNLPQAISVLRLRDGRVVVSAINGPQLSLAQARTINQCARTKLLAGQGVAAPAPAEQPPSASQPITTPPVDMIAPAGCIEGGGPFQRGTLICPNL